MWTFKKGGKNCLWWPCNGCTYVQKRYHHTTGLQKQLFHPQLIQFSLSRTGFLLAFFLPFSDLVVTHINAQYICLIQRPEGREMLWKGNWEAKGFTGRMRCSSNVTQTCEILEESRWEEALVRKLGQKAGYAATVGIVSPQLTFAVKTETGSIQIESAPSQ